MYSSITHIIFDLFGYFSIVFALIAFSSESVKKARINGLLSTSFFTLHLYYYNGYNGIFVSIISIISKLLSLFLKEEYLKYFKYSSPIIAFIFYFFINEEKILGLLPAISLIFIVFADMQKDILKMKFIYFGSAFCWLIYAIYLNSIPAILYDVFGIITLTYSIIKIKYIN